jgi:hypothetical protein
MAIRVNGAAILHTIFSDDSGKRLTNDKDINSRAEVSRPTAAQNFFGVEWSKTLQRINLTG